MPLAIAALGLTAAGAGMQIAGDQKAKNAINAARGNYVGEQAGLTRKNQAIFDKSLAESSPTVAADQMNAGQGQRMSIWDNLQKSTVPVASALPANGGTATGKAGVRAGGAANTWNKLNANAAAREGSYGDWETQQNIKNANAAQDISVNNNFAEGNARLFPLQMEQASQKGDQLSGWGHIVSTIGSLAGMFSSPTAAGAKPGFTPPPMNAPANVGFDSATAIPANTYA